MGQKARMGVPLAKTYTKQRHVSEMPVTMKHKSISNLNNHVGVAGSGAEVAPLDVGDRVPSIRVGLTERLWLAVGGVAWATKGSWSRSIIAHVRVQPIHGHRDVIPHADHQDHATIKSLAHRLHATHLREAIAILEH